VRESARVRRKDSKIDSEHRQRQSIVAVNLGLGANIFLAVLKTVTGVLGHSPALVADGINSTSDVAYYVVVRVFLRLSHKPADDEHPYGHRQLESISALVVGAFVLTTAVAIFWDAVNQVYNLLSGQVSSGGASVGALVVALFTVAAKIALTIITLRIGRQTRNPAVFALAYDHRNDIFAASAVCVGILIGRTGYPWVDPLAGAFVALIILRTGIVILRQSSEDLMDTVPGRELGQQIVELLGTVPGVKQVEETQAHRFGPYLVVNLVIGIDGSLTVADGDAIATQVERTLYENIDLLRRVHVHYHPVRDMRYAMRHAR
jgi:cation diffusion facilitator family transporter